MAELTELPSTSLGSFFVPFLNIFLIPLTYITQ
jgi:hypothetical protein